jgi:hypothetical protein
MLTVQRRKNNAHNRADQCIIDQQGSSAVADALNLQAAPALTATREAGDFRSRSPLHYLIRSNISVSLALLQIAETSLRLKKRPDEQVVVKAERAYQKSAACIELLPQEDRTSALFDLGRLRGTLDKFRSRDQSE